jgi:hypothetical protein
VHNPCLFFFFLLVVFFHPINSFKSLLCRFHRVFVHPTQSLNPIIRVKSIPGLRDGDEPPPQLAICSSSW